MANQLNGLLRTLYASLEVVSRELVGAIPSTTMNLTANSAAKGEKIRVPVTQDVDPQDIIPGSSISTTGQNLDYVDLVMDKSKAVSIPWSGDEEVGVGDSLNQIKVNQYAQAMRAIVNQVEQDTALEAVAGGLSVGNVYGTAGTIPFATDLSDLAKLRKLLEDSGAPSADRHLVLNTSAGANLRSQLKLTGAADVANDILLRGVMTSLMGFTVRESAGFVQTPASTASGYLVNGKASKHDTVIAIDTGSGAIPKGAIITFGSNQTKYVAVDGAATGATSLKISPELKDDVADNTALAISGGYLPSAAFSRDAIVLAARTPAMPSVGDNALDVTTISDPVSGLSFQVALYGVHRVAAVEIGLTWGVRCVNPKHSAVLLG